MLTGQCSADGGGCCLWRRDMVFSVRLKRDGSDGGGQNAARFQVRVMSWLRVLERKGRVETGAKEDSLMDGA
jgi:hypothetical protein